MAILRKNDKSEENQSEEQVAAAQSAELAEGDAEAPKVRKRRVVKKAVAESAESLENSTEEKEPAAQDSCVAEDFAENQSSSEDNSVASGDGEYHKGFQRTTGTIMAETTSVSMETIAVTTTITAIMKRIFRLVLRQ